MFDLSSVSSGLLQFNLTGLEGGRTYEVVIQAFTVIGPGPGSPIKSVKTKKRELVNRGKYYNYRHCN